MSHSFQGSLDLLNFPQAPTYKLSRRSDLSFQWDPPLGTRELANSLGVKYPFEESLEKQMQCAILEFIESENQTRQPPNRTSSSLFPPMNRTSPGSTSISSKPFENFANSMTTWNVVTGKLVERKSRRASYDGKKRRKVAAVRRHGACDFHRKQKTEVRWFQSLNQDIIQLLTSKSAHVYPSTASKIDQRM